MPTPSQAQRTHAARVLHALVPVLACAALALAAPHAHADAPPGAGAKQRPHPAPATHLDAHPPADAADRALRAWDTLSSAERSRVAWAWALTSPQDTPPPHQLTRCAQRADDASGTSCTMALALRGDPQATRALRDVIRRSPRPASVAAAALALSTHSDPHNDSLLISALLKGRGDGLGAAALVHAITRLDRDWRYQYLRFAMHHTPSAPARVEIAAVLSERLRITERDEPTQVLTQALHSTANAPHWSPQDQHTARLASWGLSRATHTSCDHLLGHLQRNLDQRPQHAKRIAALLPAVAPSCTSRAPTPSNPSPSLELLAQPAHPTTTTRPQPAWPAPSLAPIADTARAIARDTPQATAHTLAWLQRAQQRAHTLGLTRWAADTVASRAPKPPPSSPQPHAHTPLPDDFERAAPPLDQPAWWPAGVLLTIDDGPRPKHLNAILDTLERHNIKALFFFVGASLVRRSLDDPEGLRAQLQRVVDAGHAIGYHSMNHLTRPSQRLERRDLDQTLDDIDLFRDVFALTLGRTHPIHFGRTPGGHGSRRANVRRAFFEAGLAAPVWWTAGPPEWTPDTDPYALLDVAHLYAKRTRPALVLLHETPGLARELDIVLTALSQICKGAGAQCKRRWHD